MPTRRLVLGGLLAVALGRGLAVPALAQADTLTSIALAFADNDRELRPYTWLRRVEVVVDGQVAAIQLARLQFGEDGTLEETVLSEQIMARGRRGRGKKAKTTAELLGELRALVSRYTQLEPMRMRELLSTAKIWVAEPGTMRVQARDIVHQGDTMGILVDDLTRRPRSFSIFTSLRGEPVELRVDFGEIERGPVYPARAILETERKEQRIVITVENYDYALR